jgi:aminoglycoside N3'-acetyltransferase
MRFRHLDELRKLVRNNFIEANIARSRIVYRGISDLRQSFKQGTKFFPIPIGEIREALLQMGISQGDTLHVESSLSRLCEGSLIAEFDAVPNPVAYASGVIQMFMDLVGDEGTIIMNTDSLSRDVVTRIWAGSHGPDTIFDYTRLPSHRGLISDIFRKRADVIRSVHPWYNVTAWGKHAKEMVKDHHKSTPYAMDIHSPWYRLKDMHGKVILLGRTFGAGNPMLRLVEYVHPDEFPRGIFLDKPLKMRFVDRDQQIKMIDVKLRAPLWWHGTSGVERYCHYINQRYGVYRIKEFQNSARVVCYDAKAQYEAVYEEMTKNVTWYDPQFWQPGSN